MWIGNLFISIGKAFGGTLPLDCPPPPEGERTSVSLAELYTVVRRSVGQGGEIYIGDNISYLPTLEDIELFLDYDETNHYKYIADIPGVRSYDCNKFAAHLYGQFSVPGWADFAFGLIWTGKHAMNICVDQNRDVWFVEPQTDKRRSGLLGVEGTVHRFTLF